jgi:hypothetical protein
VPVVTVSWSMVRSTSPMDKDGSDAGATSTDANVFHPTPMRP